MDKGRRDDDSGSYGKPSAKVIISLPVKVNQTES
jgi:hypothetical protein